MGVYTYTLRAKTAKLELDGQRVTANLFMYLCKSRDEDECFFDDRQRNRARLLRASIERSCEITPVSGMVVLASEEDGKIDLHGAEVFADVKGNVWYDCDNFPATRIGWVHVEGRRRVVKTFSPWAAFAHETLCNGKWIKEGGTRRMALRDGKQVEEFADRQTQELAAMAKEAAKVVTCEPDEAELFCAYR